VQQTIDVGLLLFHQPRTSSSGFTKTTNSSISTNVSVINVFWKFLDKHHVF
jgi:hypothetical protein